VEGPAILNLTLDALLTRAHTRLEEWRKVQAAIPSLDLQPRPILDLDRQEVTLGRDQWRLLMAVDGRRSIRAVARMLGASEYDVCMTMHTLMEEGMLEVNGPALPAPRPDRRAAAEPPADGSPANDLPRDLGRESAHRPTTGEADEPPPPGPKRRQVHHRSLRRSRPGEQA
jgi:hypothetical protein